VSCRRHHRVHVVALALVFAATTFAVDAAPVPTEPATESAEKPASAPLPFGLGPKPADALYCATPNPVFSGRIAQTLVDSGTPPLLNRITDPDVYLWLSGITEDWACTAFRRYDGWAWNQDNDEGTFDWGTLINSTGVACNWTIGSTDYLKANDTADCPDSDSEYAMTVTLDAERVYQADVNHDSEGDSSFIHADCDTTPYPGAEVVKPSQTFWLSNVNNRPTANCDALTYDASSTNTVVYDKTKPALAIDAPAAGGPTIVPAVSYTVQFDVSDNLAGFAAPNDWDLQRQKATWAGTSCGTFVNDTTTGNLVSGVSQGADQTSAQRLAANTCYRWVLSATDQNGNVATPITSGSIVTDTSNVWGDQPQFRMETFGLGAGDTLAVSTGSGNVRLTHPIVSLPIRGGSLDLAASYNSHDPATVGLGPGWRLNVQRRLTVNAGGTVTFTDADGSRHTFKNPSGSPLVSYTRPDTLYATLVRDTAATPDRFTLTYRDQSKDVFDEKLTNTGLLTEIKDRHGNTVSLAYTAGTARISTISDPAGRSIALSWDGSGRLTQIVDWANVSGGIVQTSGTGNRTHRFFYDGSGYLWGWADPLNTSGSCPTNATHLTCLSYGGGLLTGIARFQTYQTIGGSPPAIGTATRTLSTTIAYTNADPVSVTDAAGAVTSFDHPSTVQTTVTRPGTPPSETTYTRVSATDALGRIGSVKRKLGGAQIETEITYSPTYPIEPVTIKENKGGGALERVTSYTYQASSLGLLTRLDEPLDGTYRRWTDHTYNANNDVTQTIVSRSGDTATDTVTRFCYTTSGCPTTATDLVLRSTIENYTDGTAGGTNGHVEDVTTSYQYDLDDPLLPDYGLRIRETRLNYSGSTLLDSAATGWTYDSSGNVTSEIRNYADGLVDTTGGDADVDPDPTTNARTDLTTVFTYDTAGNRVSTADPRRAIRIATGPAPAADDYVTRSVYDALNQQVTSRLPTTPGQSDCGSPPACLEATKTYDELGLVRTSADINDLVTATKVDQVGRALETYEDPAPPGSASITAINTYDAQGRLLTAKDRRQAATSSLGYTLNAYDELGRLTSVTDAYLSSPDVATVTSSTYDNLDQTLTETVGGVQTTTSTYDIGGRQTKTDDEFTCATTTFDYRDLALVVTEGLDPVTCGGTSQRVITNVYDLLGRLTSSEITAGEGDNDILADPTYDSAGHQLTTSATKTGATTSSSFKVNPLDETIEEIRSENGTPVSWSRTNHDAAGNATDRCVWNAAPTELCKAVGTAMSPEPAVRTTTGYDARNNRTSLAIPGVGTTTYDAAHGYAVDIVYVPTKTNGSGEVIAEHRSDHAYDSRHRLIAIDDSVCPVTPNTHTCTASAVVTGSDDYGYDDNDSRIQVVEANGAGTLDRHYCHDALNRLLSTRSAAGCTSGLLEAYTYDDAGNRLTAGATTFTYDAQGQLASCSPSCGTIAHDDTGRTSQWNAWHLTYDGEGRLASACKVSGCASGDMVTMRYDADGRRVELVTRPNGQAAVTTTFRYQGASLAQELVGGSVTRTYVTDEAGSVVKFCDPDCTGSNPQYLVTWNGHGDALALWRINADGTLTLANSFTYTTWGQPTTATHNGIADKGFRFLYVGRYGVAWDNALSLGLHHMGARHYSPALGRFLQPDPSALEGNLYRYAKNGPVTIVDSAGLLGSSLVPNRRELRLCASRPAECLWWARSGAIAIAFTKSMRDSFKENAFRHCIWQCLLAHRIGSRRAEDWGRAHEGSSATVDSNVDRHNNHVGRLFGSRIRSVTWAAPPAYWAAYFCNQAWLRGWLQTGREGVRRWSDGRRVK
jgi:RHS repeat-associated protein